MLNVFFYFIRVNIILKVTSNGYILLHVTNEFIPFDTVKV